jgi:hypothetical protein
MATQEPGLPEAMDRQATACDQLGSRQYAALIRDLRADLQGGSRTAALLDGRTDAPLRDAIVLRLLAAVHRIVLRGDAPTLASHYGSAGGDGSRIPAGLFLDVAEQHLDEVLLALTQNVQTNEVARCAALLPAFAHVSRTTALPLAMFEIGASGGLISNWDRYWYDCNGSTFGDPSSAVRFTTNWNDQFDLSGVTPVVSRRSCDIAPLDVTRADARLRLLSFIWPDQTSRFVLLTGALSIADRYAPVVDRADAGDWLDELLLDRQLGQVNVVYHSIVWQYLPRSTKDHVRAVLEREGEAATNERPLAWVRLEPAGSIADVRITLWPGAQEVVCATSSYHGTSVHSANEPVL